MARIWKGGIHPLGKKEITIKKPLLPLDLAPKRIVLPLRSPEGFMVTPVVKSGDVVKWGEKIAEPEDAQGVALFSSVSGKVVDIDHEPHPLFGWTPSIVIENDQKMTPEAYPTHELSKLSQSQILDLVQERGLRGMARDNAPIHRKISASQDKVDTLIVNATECEPYLTADHRLLLERHEMVISGSLLLAKATGAKEIVLAIQGDKIDAIEALEHSEFWDKSRMRVRTIPTRYPFGHEKQVLRFVTGVELPSGADCLFARCVVFNVATVYAVAEGILEGKPQTHRAITMAGGAIQRPRNFWLPIGTPMSCVIENAEGLRENPAVILSGGPMTGVSQRDLRAPILVNTTGILALSPWEVPLHLLEKNRPTMPCIGCGHCLSVCPMHLSPNQIYRHMDSPRHKTIAPLHPEDCISCGCCNYRCPAHLPLAQTMQAAQEFLKGDKPTEVEPDVKVYVPSKEEKKKKGKKQAEKTAKHKENGKAEPLQASKTQEETATDGVEKQSKKNAKKSSQKNSKNNSRKKSKQNTNDLAETATETVATGAESPESTAEVLQAENPETKTVPPQEEHPQKQESSPESSPEADSAQPEGSAVDEDMILAFLHQSPAPKLPTLDSIEIPQTYEVQETPEVFVEILPESEPVPEPTPEPAPEPVSDSPPEFEVEVTSGTSGGFSVEIPPEVIQELPSVPTPVPTPLPSVPVMPPVKAIVPDSEVEVFVELLPDDLPEDPPTPMATEEANPEISEEDEAVFVEVLEDPKDSADGKGAKS